MAVANKKMKCIVVDDEAIAIEGLQDYIDRIDFLEIVATPSSSIEAGEVLKTTSVDLMFLDINMPHLSGLEFLESLDKAPLVILTTAYSEYALDGYRLNVADYLLKPIGFQRFFQAVSKAYDIFTSRLTAGQGDNTEMFIRQGNSFRKLDVRQILYAEGMQNYVKLHMEKETVVIHQTMASLEGMLPADRFYRIHKSYLVNTSHIGSVSGNRVFVGDTELPLSSQRMDDFLNSVVYKNLISK